MNALLSPTDPTPRTEPIDIALPTGEQVEAVLDFYSERVRCDHPQATDGAALGDALREEAEMHGSGRVVVLAPDPLVAGLEATGYTCEAVMPGFYNGQEDCAVLGLALDAQREALGDEAAVARVEQILEAKRGTLGAVVEVDTRRAEVSDAESIAALIAETFSQYPTPSGDPDYIARAIESGVPFRTVEADGRVVACASADLVRDARTAELTDCATLPSFRGHGFMRAILADLMGDLEQMGYPTAFTLARAVEPGINVAFQRLGFELRGRMVRSCRIGGGLEDMNVWSRRLAA
ncbi:MAG: putative beta-lysine N-acetyltransferase [Deltaproteobacteria bacterium]|nr:MAG: putative beta-lysine N-acetyltransferase [Deltaproteobacteria bacterium]